MKKLMFNACLMLLSLNAYAEIQLYHNPSSIIAAPGQESDITGEYNSPTRHYDNFIINGGKDYNLSRILWTGTTLPDGLSAPLIVINLHNNIHDTSEVWYRQDLPDVTPFAKFFVSPTVVEEPYLFPSGHEVVPSPGVSFFSAEISGAPTLLSGEIYWISIAFSALSPLELPEDYVWHWGRANGLGMSVTNEFNTPGIQVTSQDMFFDLFGLYDAPLLVDTDGDSIFDTYDLCPNTPTTESANDDGCSLSQIDTDNDGFTDDVDQCVITVKDESVDGTGCSATQRDTDNDGALDAYDNCPGTPAGAPVDIDGCELI